MKYSELISDLVDKYFPKNPVASGPLPELDQVYNLTYFYQALLNTQISVLLAGQYLDKDFDTDLLNAYENIQKILTNLSGSENFAIMVENFRHLITVDYIGLDYFIGGFAPTKHSQIRKRVNHLTNNVIYTLLEAAFSSPWLNQEFIKSHINLFNTSIKVAVIDHGFAASPEESEELIAYKLQVENNIKTLNSSAVTIETETYHHLLFLAKLLIDKIDYLISMIGKRLKEDGKSFSFVDSFSNIELNEKSIFNFPEVTEMYRKNEKILPDESTVLNYKDAESKSIFDKFHQHKPLCLYEFRILTRLASSSKRIKITHSQILEHFLQIKELHKTDCSYDQHALNLMHLYILNNHLSYKIKEGTSYMDLRSDLNSINTFSIQYGIQNYFTDKKICHKLVDEFNAEFTKGIHKEGYLEKLDSVLRELDEKLEELDASVLWSDRLKFIPFRETRAESTKNVKNPEKPGMSNDLFIASAYSIPLDYSSIKIEVSGLRSLPAILKQQLQNARNLLQYSNEVFDLKSKLESSQTKQIEILSVFAAIVLFVSGNIQIFTKVDTLAQGLHFMFIFALSLSLFVSLIWVVFKDRNQDIHKKQWIIISIYFFFLVLGVISFSPGIMDLIEKSILRLLLQP